MAHRGPCKCAAPNGKCRWHATEGGTKHPLKEPAALGEIPASLQPSPKRSFAPSPKAKTARSTGDLRRGQTPNAYHTIPGEELLQSGVVDDQIVGGVQWNPGSFSRATSAAKSRRSTASAKSLHPRGGLCQREDFQEAVIRYPTLCNRQGGRAASTFMPFSGHRRDPIHADVGSRDSEELARKRVHHEVFNKAANAAMASTIGPLDAKWHHDEGHKGMMIKLSERMKREGYAADRHPVIHQAMMEVLHETPKLLPPPV